MSFGSVFVIVEAPAVADGTTTIRKALASTGDGKKITWSVFFVSRLFVPS